MTSREVLGWRIPRSVRDAFIQFVEEKWGSTESYVRFELESAMREFLDKDDLLYEAEQLLRDLLQSQGLSSSSPVLSDERADHSETVQLGYRVHSELKDEFAAFAKQHYDENLGAILARALNSYRDGGRRQRILEKIHQLTTGGINADTTASADESGDNTSRGDENLSQDLTQSGGSDENPIASQSRRDQHNDTTTQSDDTVAVDLKVVSEVAGELGDEFTRADLEQAIAKTLDGNRETIEQYTENIISYKNVVKHPVNNDVFIPEEERAEMTAYGDLDRQERAEKLRIFITRETLKKRRMADDATYTEVQKLFKNELGEAPSDDYAYTLMDDAAEEPGFKFKKRNGQKRLHVDIHSIKRRIIEEAADNHDVEVKVGINPPEIELESPEGIERDENTGGKTYSAD